MSPGIATWLGWDVMPAVRHCRRLRCPAPLPACLLALALTARLACPCAVGLLEGLSLQQSAQKLEQAFLPTFKARRASCGLAHAVPLTATCVCSDPTCPPAQPLHIRG